MPPRGIDDLFAETTTTGSWARGLGRCIQGIGLVPEHLPWKEANEDNPPLSPCHQASGGSAVIPPSDRRSRVVGALVAAHGHRARYEKRILKPTQLCGVVARLADRLEAESSPLPLLRGSRPKIDGRKERQLTFPVPAMASRYPFAVQFADPCSWPTGQSVARLDPAI
jgi:hypothetical protein